MIVLNENERDLIIDVAIMEANFINGGFRMCESSGVTFFKNSIESFEIFLTNKYGEIKLPMSSHYRCFITELLERIDNKYLPVVMAEMFK